MTVFSTIQASGACPMCDMMLGMGWWGMLLMALFWIVVLGLAGWLIYRLFRGWSRNRGRESPEEVLRERYARGEIDRATYQRMREDLRE